MPAISEALEKAKFTKFYVFLQAGCLPYSGTINYDHRHYNCDDWVNVSFNEFLDFVKPEIIILTARYVFDLCIVKPNVSVHIFLGCHYLRKLYNRYLQLIY